MNTSLFQKVALLLFFVFLIPAMANAATCTAQVDGGDWNDSATWSCGRIPLATDDVAIPAGYTIDLDLADFGGSVTIASLTLLAGPNNPNNTILNVTGSGNFNVNGNLTLNAKTDLNLSGVDMTVTGAFNWSNGGNIDLIGVGGTTSTLEVQGCASGNGPITNIITGNISWCVGTNAGDSGTGCDQAGGGPGGCNQVLPIELLSFNAKLLSQQSVLLDWVTISEINNDYFTIEKSLDGLTFTACGQIEAAGTSKETLKYQFIDNGELFPITYYRLKQTDFDGTFSYSRIREVRLEVESLITLFPNPTADSHFQVKATQLKQLSVSVYSLSGKELMLDSDVEQNSGFSEGTYQIKDASKGLYIVVIQTEIGTLKKKLLVLK